jgi:hypothetical protein
MLLVPRRDDELDLGLERARRAALAMVVDGDDVPAALRDQVEDVAQLPGRSGSGGGSRGSGPPASGRAGGRR